MAYFQMYSSKQTAHHPSYPNPINPCFHNNPAPHHPLSNTQITTCTTTPSKSTPSHPSLIPLSPTPLTPLHFRNHKILIKRDDLLHHSTIRGSKLRKFHALLTPRTLPSNISLLSYGGVQSNAMLALARLAYLRNLPFYYITRPIPPHLPRYPGNFTDALALNMRHIELSTHQFRAEFLDIDPAYANLVAENAVIRAFPNAFREGPGVTVPQGGAFPLAEPGIRRLAHELRTQITDLRKCGCFTRRKIVLFLASGTGTTAYYLAKHLHDFVHVVTVPVSGDERYLLRQMRRLAAWEGGNVALPGILRPRLRGSFADVRMEKLAMWREMSRAARDFEFDLVYAPKVWEEFMLAVGEGRIDVEDADLIYYHSGGVEGNKSMIDRFRRKGLWSDT